MCYRCFHFFSGPCLLGEGSIFGISCSITYIRVSFKFFLPIRTSRFTALLFKLMTGNNVARQKLYAHGLIYEISNCFSEAYEFATTLAACAICLHRVVRARRSRVAAGLEVQPADYNVFFSAFPICPRISLIVQCDRPSLVVLILAGLFFCS